MKEQAYIAELFQNYEDTPELRDFKEEITINLQERIKDLISKGLTEEGAFDKAVAELGDITDIADQISKQKRNEIINKMYMKNKTQVTKKQAIGYVISGGVFLFGLIIAFITYFSTDKLYAAFAAISPFFALGGAGFVYFGLRQETARNFAMDWKRALLYAIGSGLTLFGLILAAMLLFMDHINLEAVFGTLIPFVIPGICILGFLLLTEKKRHKPWVIQEQEVWAEHYVKLYSDPKLMEQSGLLSGGLWILSFALFAVLGFIIGFQYAWVIFLFTIAAQMFIQYWVQSKSK